MISILCKNQTTHNHVQIEAWNRMKENLWFLSIAKLFKIQLLLQLLIHEYTNIHIMAWNRLLESVVKIKTQIATKKKVNATRLQRWATCTYQEKNLKEQTQTRNPEADHGHKFSSSSVDPERHRRWLIHDQPFTKNKNKNKQFVFPEQWQQKVNYRIFKNPLFSRDCFSSLEIFPPNPLSGIALTVGGKR